MLGAFVKLLDISTAKYPNTFAKVDDEDFDWLNQWKWCPNFCKHTNKTYIVRRLSMGEARVRKNIKLHRLLLDFPVGMMVDHVDGDGLNNQRVNLRTCTRFQNAANRARSDKRSPSAYKGVGWRAGMFFCSIYCEGRVTRVGRDVSESVAAAMYNKAAIHQHGEFAVLNIINHPGMFVRAPDLSEEELKTVRESGYLQRTTPAEAGGG